MDSKLIQSLECGAYIVQAFPELFPLGDNGELLSSKKSKKSKKKQAMKGKKVVPKKKKPEMRVPEGLTLEQIIEWKKDIRQSFPAHYDPDLVESHWNEWWEKKRFYCPTGEEAMKCKYEEKFIMVIPPPNVTGSLHIGHALTNSIQDCMTRWNRMKGKITVWVPGCDHAGIATQSVVEKSLWLNEKKTRHDYGRKKFVEKVFEWKEDYGKRIANQERRMGISTDWERDVFTMDEKRSKAVIEAFVRLYKMKLIYRSDRLVNWSCKLQSAISDIEVEYKDLTEPISITAPGHKEPSEFGTLTKFAYKVQGTDEEIIVATTRLETMLGDTAVAVNSKDPRYTHLVGKKLIHPFIPDRDFCIITDDVLVDPKFGTGAVKITPAHDAHDYKCGQDNKLKFINIFEDDGRINKNGGKYKGMMRYECRNQMLSDMKELGIYRGTEKNVMRIGFCSRSGDVIEPMLRPQWWVDCQDIAKKMVKKVETEELKIRPAVYKKTWYQWLNNCQDWCISRQLWWGHRIPAYLARKKGTVGKWNIDSTTEWIVAKNAEEALEEAAVRLNLSQNQIELYQDEDVLDTWFSSALFPFAAFGWPDVHLPEFKGFYPTTMLETGYDILFFWVARMVMFGLLLTEQLPFKYVYLHPIVRDAFGRKMSKSLGNVVNPLDIINGQNLENLLDFIKNSPYISQKEKQIAIRGKKKEFPKGIPACGSDALRFALLAYMVQQGNINLAVERIVSYRHMCNKLWNTVKFASTFLMEDFTLDHTSLTTPNNLQFINRWILSRLNQAAKTMNENLTANEFGLATQTFVGF